MADIEAKFAPFTTSNLNMGGVREVLKSGPVESQLMGKAQGIASACCAACYSDRGSEGHKLTSREAPFRGWTSQGGYTAFGHVSTVNLEGLRFESSNKIIDSYNH